MSSLWIEPIVQLVQQSGHLTRILRAFPFLMGDPLWSDRFQPVLAKAIPLLTHLLRRELIKRLLAKQLIDLNDYDHFVDALKRKPWAETSARELYQILRQKPEPSFATFCDVLLKVGGEDLHCLLKYGEVPLVINVETDNEEFFKSHSNALITILKVYMEQATGIPNRRVRSTTKFMNPMTPKALVSVARSAEIRILIPTIDHRCFRLYEEKVVKVITDFMETRNFVLEICYMHDIIYRLHPDDRSQGIYDDATSSVTVNRSHDHSGDHSQEIYDEALKHGFVTVNRSRVIVAGQDGAGKSCFVDSLLNRPFKKDRESTEGAAVELTHTATNGWVATERGDHLDPLIAEGVYRMNQQPSSSSSKSVQESKDLDAQETEADKSERYYGSSTAVDTVKPTPAVITLAEKLKAVGIEAKTLTPNQQRLASSFLADKPSEEDLTKKIVSIRDIWDLGGQEIYLATHSALIPDSKEFGLCMYMIVMDISKSLSAKAESFCRSIDGEGRKKKQSIDLSWIRTNGDFPLYWFGSITAAHEDTSSGDHQLGQDEEVAYPPVFAIGSHRDVLDNDKERFPDSASVKDWLKKQGQLFKQLLKDSDFKQHIVVPKKRGIGEDDDDFREMAHFFKRIFLIDNSVSGSESFCKGVREIRERIDRMTATYWKGMKKKKKQPLYWVYLEILLFRWREVMGKVVANVEEIVKLAQHPTICNISKRDEVLVALKYLANVGAVLFYPEVDGLDDVVFTRPMSVIKCLSAFVTAETVPYMKPEWAKLKKNGIMSNKLMTYRLGQMQKSDSASSLTEENKKQIEDDNKRMVKLLELLDVITPVKGSSPTEFYIPSMLKKRFLSSPSTTYWECLTLSDSKPRCCTLPAPLIVIPMKLKFVPECLFFRLITRFLKVYPNKPRLSRHQCIFLAQDEDSPVQGTQQHLS